MLHANWQELADLDGREGMKLRIYVLALLAFAMASFLLFNFAAIWAYGKFFIYESNRVGANARNNNDGGDSGFQFLLYC